MLAPRPTLDSIDRLLATVRQDVRDEAERAYFLMHQTRYRLTLREVQRVAGRRRLEILDVGCYPYHVGAVLDRLGHQVSGISSYHEPLAAQHVAVLNVERDPFPYADGRFDLVLFNEVLEHLPHSPVLALGEMRRVTRAGGHLLLTTPNVARVSNRLLLLLGRSIAFPIDSYFEHGGQGNDIYYRHNREYTLPELVRLVQHGSWQVERATYMLAYTPFGPRMVPDPWRLAHDPWWSRAGKLASYAAKRALPSLRDTLCVVARKD